MTQSLAQEFDALAKYGALTAQIPACISENLAASITLRPYQERALERFIFYMEKYPNRPNPAQLLFHMATGSGKTVLMAALILYLYSKGQRNFLFFVNSSQIIEKTKDNFLNWPPASTCSRPRSGLMTRWWISVAWTISTRRWTARSTSTSPQSRGCTAGC